MRATTFLFVIFVIAVALRLGFTIAYRGGLDVVPVQSIAGADGVEYDQLGRNMAAGMGYVWDNGQPTSFRAPGFPLVLALLYSIAGTSYPAAYISFALWGGLGIVSTYFLGSELLGDMGGRIAAILAAIYPGDVYACSYFFSEIVFVPCLGFGLWLLARHGRTHSVSSVLIAGLLLGYTALARSFGILFLPVFGLYLIGLPPTRRGLIAAVIFGMAFLAIIAPWTYRNYEVHHRFVLIATNGGSTFYGANNDLVTAAPRQYGNWVSTTKLAGRDLIDAQPDEVSHDKMEWKLGIDWVKHHPGKFALLAPFKLIRLWLPFVQWPSLTTYPIANIALTSPFLILIGIGMVTTLVHRKDWRAFAVLHLTMSANFVMVVIFWGDPRFRDANVPVLMVYAAIGGCWLTNRLRLRSPHTGMRLSGCR
jgi:4-amino-4-deoxy-L-arabinose transferase-like glycosyltransferase